MMVGAGAIVSEMLTCPLFTLGFRGFCGSLLSVSPTSERLKSTVPLALFRAVICNIHTIPVPVGAGKAVPLKSCPNRVNEKSPLEGNLPAVVYEDIGRLGIANSPILVPC